MRLERHSSRTLEPLSSGGLSRFGIVLVVLGTLLLGFAAMAVLPMFEGPDEEAHVSSVLQIASTGRAPVYGEDGFARAVTAYWHHGPLFIPAAATFQHPGSVFYRAFFQDSQKVAAYGPLYREGPAPHDYVSDPAIVNWQAQHPPAYYVLMAGVMHLTQALPWVTQTFVLRGFSFLLAYAGLLLGLMGALRAASSSDERRCLTCAFLLYPVLFPSFFAEFGRIGNDSLCLFLTGAIAAQLALEPRQPHRPFHHVLLGGLFALGLLTKGFFLPFTAGYVAWRLIPLVRDRRDQALTRARWEELEYWGAPVVLTMIWYASKALVYGSFLGGADGIVLKGYGGLTVETLAWRFDPPVFLHILANILQTWSWFGGGSYWQMPLGFSLLLLMLPLGLLVAALKPLRREKPTAFASLGFFWIGLMVLGFLHHILVCLALAGFGATPGWYLNILIPVWGVWLAKGLGVVVPSRPLRGIVVALATLHILALPVLMIAQAFFFAGLADLSPDRHVVLNAGWDSPATWGLLRERLGVLGWPDLAAVGLVVGGISLAMGAALVGRSLFRSSTAPQTLNPRRCSQSCPAQR